MAAWEPLGDTADPPVARASSGQEMPGLEESAPRRVFTAPVDPSSVASRVVWPIRALPVLTPVVFWAQGSEHLLGWERENLSGLAFEVARAGMRNWRAGVALPRIDITGYGVGGEDTKRAWAVYEAFTGFLEDALRALQQGLPAGERPLGVRHFALTVQASGWPSEEAAELAGVAREDLVRRATVGVTLSADAEALERLEVLHGRDRRFRSGPFDVDVLARHV
ncbi:hypothetical protein AB4Z54_50395, partial [Streptomyces sp. MCAF7]